MRVRVPAPFGAHIVFGCQSVLTGLGLGLRLGLGLGLGLELGLGLGLELELGLGLPNRLIFSCEEPLLSISRANGEAWDEGLPCEVK